MIQLFRVRTLLIGTFPPPSYLACLVSFCPPFGNRRAQGHLYQKGHTLKTVSAMLEKEGIIRNRHLFVAFTTLLGKKMEIKAGEYELHTRHAFLWRFWMLW